ncbi:GNAT family N-acetyltransferase [Sinomicrobium weinanense]|uniref:GNAT family N-acetyltransferase n=1 Tax=Sinomicrobium weinanense TaxID=2842200 RepID=A0A926JP39_9FLAO|nr:GNAT family N-acetyltransferase [Sinomicrobium weinanense]MBC9794870.1 GNAT family N-acetyltransferase [Sinomicrobium weinanense]MBU3125641.1 GNAT family N-acetyltransferase [Sinomicrobium weinanense]
MIIRKATREDSQIIAPYIMLAMGEIARQFIGENNPEKATLLLEDLIARKGNQYSYENCWVAENENKVIAAALVYDGAQLKALRKPVSEEIKARFNRELNLESETQAGEFYIDCIGVNPDQQGKGVGSKMLRFLIDKYVQKENKILGLLVDKDNPLAKKLYLRLGFEIVGEKTLAGKSMEHLQCRK